MLTSFVLGAALVAPAAPVPRDTNPAPVGPAPWVVYLKADDSGRVALTVYKNLKVTQTRLVTTVENGNPVTKQVQEEVDRLLPSYLVLGDLNARFATAQGTALTPEGVMRRAKDGLVVLVSADGKPVEKAWLRAVDPDAVVVTAEGLVSPVAPRPAVAVPTAAPRLVLLGTGADGKVQVAYNPMPGGGFGGNVAVGRGGRVVFVNNGGVNQPVFLNEDVSFTPTVPAVSAGAPVKALEDVTFDACDLTGKLIGREDVLKRLKAGGLVLVAGDNRVPDPAYLKMFRGDLLVLVSTELLTVPGGGVRPGVARAVALPVPVAPPALLVPAVPLAAPAAVPAGVPVRVLRPVMPARPAVAPAPVVKSKD
ncbi:MAG: hypothetical protein JWO38_3347 [Gemmataceae bacterium]|nr:hypothetical protein [Gemmataceae bacterium]